MVEYPDKIIAEDIAPKSAFVQRRIDKVLDLFMCFRQVAPMDACANMMDGVVAVVKEKLIGEPEEIA